MKKHALIHVGINTFTGKDWGSGTEQPDVFAPTSLDPDQWVKAAKSFGAKALILVAKQNEFCLWPSAFTEHSVKNSSWRDGKGDVDPDQESVRLEALRGCGD